MTKKRTKAKMAKILKAKGPKKAAAVATAPPPKKKRSGTGANKAELLAKAWMEAQGFEVFRQGGAAGLVKTKTGWFNRGQDPFDCDLLGQRDTKNGRLLDAAALFAERAERFSKTGNAANPCTADDVLLWNVQVTKGGAKKGGRNRVARKPKVAAHQWSRLLSLLGILRVSILTHEVTDNPADYRRAKNFWRIDDYRFDGKQWQWFGAQIVEFDRGALKKKPAAAASPAPQTEPPAAQPPAQPEDSIFPAPPSDAEIAHAVTQPDEPATASGNLL